MSNFYWTRFPSLSVLMISEILPSSKKAVSGKFKGQPSTFSGSGPVSILISSLNVIFFSTFLTWNTFEVCCVVYSDYMECSITSGGGNDVNRASSSCSVWLFAGGFSSACFLISSLRKSTSSCRLPVKFGSFLAWSLTSATHMSHLQVVVPWFL